MTREGEPWFVLADVCKVLDISNSRDASARLDEDEKADVGITDTSPNGPGQRRTVTAINESGLYSLVLTSRKPEEKGVISLCDSTGGWRFSTPFKPPVVTLVTVAGRRMASGYQ
jgi:hypothetical protein